MVSVSGLGHGKALYKPQIQPLLQGLECPALNKHHNLKIMRDTHLKTDICLKLFAFLVIISKAKTIPMELLRSKPPLSCLGTKHNLDQV